MILVDGTCVSMPARPPGLFEQFGSSTGRGDKRHYPLARMVTLALANTMAILNYAVGRYRMYWAGPPCLTSPSVKLGMSQAS